MRQQREEEQRRAAELQQRRGEAPGSEADGSPAPPVEGAAGYATGASKEGAAGYATVASKAGAAACGKHAEAGRPSPLR
jgi:hypothetical protein